MHLQSVYIDRSGDWCRSANNTGYFYLRHEVDEVISTIKAERDEYRYNLSCARNEIHNMSIGMKDDIKTIAELKDDYKEACDRLQTANLISKEQREKADKLLSCLKCLVMRNLIKDCPEKEAATEIVKEFK
jgi:hypothetical protein